MVPTLILNSDVNIEEFKDSLELTQQFDSENIIENINNAIEWAIRNNEDVIYCVCTETKKRIEFIPSLADLIYELVEQKLYFYFVDTIHQDEIAINSNIAIISGIQEVRSFVLTRPIYTFVKTALLDIEFDQIKLIQLFQAMFSFHITIFPTSNLHIATIEKHIRIIAPFRNVAQYLEDFLLSIENQHYKNYSVYFVDDCSNDDSINLIPEDPKYFLKINTTRKYAIENILSILINYQFNDDDIICLIDPDDKLSNSYVFNILNNVYSRTSVMLTYGSMRYIGSQYKFGSPYSKEEFDEIRKSNWRIAHLRTFKFKVFKELIKQDPFHENFKNLDGQYLRMPYDMALMFPLLEICGYQQVKYIDSILYEYRQHPENDSNINKREQYAGEQTIRGKAKLRQIVFE